MFGGEQMDKASRLVALPNTRTPPFLEPLVEDEQEQRTGRERDQQEQPHANPAQNIASRAVWTIDKTGTIRR
jgi:hypothetical protein